MTIPCSSPLELSNGLKVDPCPESERTGNNIYQGRGTRGHNRDPKDPIITYGINSDIASVTGSSDYQIAADKVKLLEADRRSVLVGRALMHEHGWKIGEPITLRNPGDAGRWRLELQTR